MLNAESARILLAVPRLPYIPENFGPHYGSVLVAPSAIHFTWEELCRASITVGRRSWADVWRHGRFSSLEALWRLAIIRANLLETPNGDLRQSGAYAALDPSEKSGVSYFLGLALTKLVAEKLFDVPWLLHLDRYKEDIQPHLAFPERPDFVGMDAWRMWMVAESKGRSRGVPRSLIDTGKQQVLSLRRIGAEYPLVRIVVATYFTKSLRARIRDPSAADRLAFDIELTPEQLARAYYRPIVEMIQSVDRSTRPMKSTREEITTQLESLDATLSLQSDIASWFLTGEPSWETVLERRRSEISILKMFSVSADQATGNEKAIRRDEILLPRLRQIRRTGLDGVTVELGPSWDDVVMRKEPEAR